MLKVVPERRISRCGRRISPGSNRNALKTKNPLRDSKVEKIPPDPAKKAAVNLSGEAKSFALSVRFEMPFPCKNFKKMPFFLKVLRVLRVLRAC